jgi:hypothetical protein
MISNLKLLNQSVNNISANLESNANASFQAQRAYNEALKQNSKQQSNYINMLELKNDNQLIRLDIAFSSVKDQGSRALSNSWAA